MAGSEEVYDIMLLPQSKLVWVARDSDAVCSKATTCLQRYPGTWLTLNFRANRPVDNPSKKRIGNKQTADETAPQSRGRRNVAGGGQNRAVAA